MTDPAFLFYPGDYLRDTQCLSESVQVAYDRIMCEHMRNICISKQQLNFFTKRLTSEQKSELLQVLTEVTGGYQIRWVAESIEKRRKYSDSRRKNRVGQKKHMLIISDTYDSHMENENENENRIKERGAGETIKTIGTGQNFILITPQIPGSDKYRIHGNDGLQEFFELSGSILREPEQARKFMHSNAGKHYNNFQHLFNDYKQFCKKQFA